MSSSGSVSFNSCGIHSEQHTTKIRLNVFPINCSSHKIGRDILITFREQHPKFQQPTNGDWHRVSCNGTMEGQGKICSIETTAMMQERQLERTTIQKSVLSFFNPAPSSNEN